MSTEVQNTTSSQHDAKLPVGSSASFSNISPKVIVVEVTPMQKHILVKPNWGGEYKTIEIAKYEFADLCDRLNIPEPEDFNNDGFVFDAGGIGYDYRISMYPKF